MGLAAAGYGSLTVGGAGDAAVFKKHETTVRFGDREDLTDGRELRTGAVLYEPVLTVKSGMIVYRNILH